MDNLKIEDLDIYELLEISLTANENEIKKAYRKKALKCHPDKNPDNPDASKEFHRLTAILEILTDAAARKAYDNILKGRKEAALRHKELDSKRRKLKEDLEFRERQAAGGNKSATEKSASQKLQEEIERLRKEGSRQVEEEMEYVLRQIQREKEQGATVEESDGSKYRIKMKWAATKDDPDNGGYTQEMLEKFLSKYGDISVLVVSAKRKGSALVEFKTKRAAEMAVELEIGRPQNPLKLEWVNPPQTGRRIHSNTIKESDFESVVLTKMRQAEERKRLIQQMMEEEAGD